jgi:CheY-like chemotaxis protein
VDVKFDPATILVVDDIPYNRELIYGYLQNTRFVILEAENGKDALDLLSKKKIELILMDLRMPGQDGYELTEIIKKDNELKHIPVIALTASAMKEAEQKITGLFDGYLRKPVNEKQLLSELKRFLPHQTENITTSDTTHSKEEIFSDALKADLPELIKTLENSFLPRAADISEIMIIDEVEDFSAELKDTALKYHMQFLADYADQLYAHTQNYSVDEMENKIKEFPGIIDMLKKIK